MKSQNRRKHERRAAYIIVEYRIAEGTFRDILKSIGANGLYVSTRRSVAQGQPIDLKFPLFRFEEEIEISGKIIRSDPYGFAVSFDRPIEDLICEKGRFPSIVHEIDRRNI